MAFKEQFLQKWSEFAAKLPAEPVQASDAQANAELLSEKIRLYIETYYTDEQQAQWLASTNFDEQMAELVNSVTNGVTGVIDAALSSVQQFFKKLE